MGNVRTPVATAINHCDKSYRRRGSFWGTLRWRLTAWYVLLLSLMLLFFVASMFLQLRQALLDREDRILQSTATHLLPLVLYQQGVPAFAQSDMARHTLDQLQQQSITVRVIPIDQVVSETLLTQDEHHPNVFTTAPLYLTTHQDGNDWRVYSLPLKDTLNRPSGWLLVSQTTGWIQAGLDAVYQRMLLILPLGIIFAGVAGYFLASKAFRPISRVTSLARSLDTQDLSMRIGYPRKHRRAHESDEIAQLTMTFDAMLDRLQAAFERERRFTADASHELRTPLTAIKGSIEVLLSRPRSQQEYVQVLHGLSNDVDRLIRISNDLLLLARLEEEPLHIAKQPIFLSDLLDAVCDSMQSRVETKQVTLMSSIPPGLNVYGDMDHLMRLFVNLLDNAIKYTPSDGTITLQATKLPTGNTATGVTPQTTTSLISHQVNNYTEVVSIVIQDTGQGIAAEHLPHLFERFYRVEHNSASHGSGLGLALAHEIVRWHGGQIELASTPGKGTSVTIYLPLFSSLHAR